MHVVATIILIGWGVFWISWLAAAVGVKRGRIRWGRQAGIRVVLVLVVLVLVRAKPFKGQTITTDPWLESIGLTVFVSGLAVAVWARLSLGRNWGSPMSEKVDAELVTTGPYRSVRHPIYSGIILALVGTAVAVSWYWLTAVALAGTYFVFSAVMEERYLAARFPETYPAYKRTTRMLIPFLL
ncbi:MAG: isoprenylcysteine carboxylmethyltransferase family protein [Acidimicrobiia bacterium]|nr:isoprenylcysteine carboxylmethyltransferase family protein [Acidimicrobiia bacterium]